MQTADTGLALETLQVRKKCNAVHGQSHSSCNSAAAAAAEKAEASSSTERKQTSGGNDTLDREAIMTPATRHTKEARRSGPEAERNEDPSMRTRLLAYGKDGLPILRQQSAAASGDVRRAKSFGATHTNRRSPDLRVLQLPVAAAAC